MNLNNVHTRAFYDRGRPGLRVQYNKGGFDAELTEDNKHFVDIGTVFNCPTTTTEEEVIFIAQEVMRALMTCLITLEEEMIAKEINDGEAL